MYSHSEALKRQALFQDALSKTLDNAEWSELETLSVVFEEDHFHMILESMKEVKEGQIVSFQDAFLDLD